MGIPPKGLSLYFRGDQHLVGDGFCPGSASGQRPEGGVAGAAPVEAEDELVEVGLEVLGAQAVVDAKRPGLEVGKDPVDPGQDDMGGPGADDMRLVVTSGAPG